ncbi:MAG: hypothetical protein ACOYI7_01840 [Candidatus Excrementavichristensenella sp.]|jgi:hypothetical protein
MLLLKNDWDEVCNNRYSEAQKHYNIATSMLGSKAPFIGKDFFNDFREIQVLSAKQINADKYSEPLKTEKSNLSIRRNEQAGYSRTTEIAEKWAALHDSLRLCFNIGAKQ